MGEAVQSLNIHTCILQEKFFVVYRFTNSTQEKPLLLRRAGKSTTSSAGKKNPAEAGQEEAQERKGLIACGGRGRGRGGQRVLDISQQGNDCRVGFEFAGCGKFNIDSLIRGVLALNLGIYGHVGTPGDW